MPLAAPATVRDRSVRDPSVRAAVRRLAVEFPELGPQTIMVVVNTCREELRGSPDGALPELVERLARHRLQVSIPEVTGGHSRG